MVHQSDAREYELVKPVSLVVHDRAALIELKQTGRCEIDLDESVFDADHPGHYLRRLRAVSASLPAVIVPNTTVNCTLTLLKSKVRVDANAEVDYPEDASGDSRFRADFGVVASIATSHGRDDAGLHELCFGDDRYLPFEGAGAISTWRIELPRDANAFDLDSLSDVILRLRYTAREGGDQLREKARAAWITGTAVGGSPRRG